jgi:two-component system cell cycle sensor histidine kinase/response regulator CckA
MPEWTKLPPRLPGAVRSYLTALADDQSAPVDSFQTLFDASPLPLMVTTVDDGVIVDVNAIGEALSGYRRAELRGRSVFEFGLYRDAADRRAQIATIDAEPALGREVRLVTAHGEALHLLAHTSRLDLDGRPCFLTAFTNVTALARLDDAMLAAQRLEVAGKLSGGIAHEFNNLLTVMQGHIEALADDAAGVPAVQARVEALDRAVAQATRITSGLLTFSGHYPSSASTLDLNATLDGLRSLVTGTLGETIEVTWQLRATPATVRIAHAHVAQVILNLALNAREAMPEGGRLTLSTAYVTAPDGPDAGAWVCLRVADTGHGMTDDVRRRAFEPFFTTKGPGRGTGLGLSICRGIAEQHGGRITVLSDRGRGTTVTLHLPWVTGEADGEAVAPPAGAREAPARPGRVVLLVEDEAEVRYVVGEILRRAGHTVHPADGLAAAEAVLDGLGGPIDVLLTDLVLPGGSGLEVARRVQARQPGVPVLYMSGYAENVFRGSQPVEHLLHKPFTSRTLLAALDAVVTR